MNIKDYRDKELKSYVIGLNVLLFLLIFKRWFGIDFSEESLKKALDIKELLIPILEMISASSIVGVFVFVLDAIYSAEAKDKLTLVGILKKPGMKIFTKIKNRKLKDDRINLSKAQAAYQEIVENIPEDKSKYKYENDKWYAIFIEHEKEEKILISQRDYLLCRDICIATISEAMLVLLSMIMGIIPWSFKELGLLGVIYIITVIASYNKADCFCRNVIARDLAMKK